MKVSIFLLVAFFLAPVFAFSEIAGKYRVYGSQPNWTYKSTVVIEKRGHVYTVSWTDDDGSTETGTGVRRGDYLSIVFKEGGEESYGVQVYKISNDHLQGGPWAWYGETWKGYERLRKIH